MNKKNINVIIKTIKFLWKTSRFHFIFMCLFSVLTSLPEIVILYIWKKILDYVSISISDYKVDITKIVFFMLIYFCANLVALVFNKISYFNINIYKFLLEKYLTNKHFDIINSLELFDLESNETLNKLKIMQSEAGNRTLGILTKTMELLQNVVLVSFISGLLLSMDFKFVIVIILAIIPLAFSYKNTYSDIFKAYKDRVEKIRLVNTLKEISCKVDFILENKVYNVAPYLKDKCNKNLDEIIKQDRKLKKKLFARETIFENISSFAIFAIKTVAILTGILLKKSIGDIVMTTESFDKIKNSISNMVLVMISLYDDSLYLDAVFELERICEVNIKKNKEAVKLAEINKIELKDIGYQYINSDRFAIKNVNLSFEKGKTYAIVGKNGSGKTTLIKLILGFYRPTIGDIYINGISIKEYNTSHILSKCSVVFQEYLSYPMSIYENIMFSEYNEEKKELFRKACEDSNVSEFMKGLHLTEKQVISKGWENSVDLSGGQWQRVAIARFFAKDANILVLDEPASSLDSSNERDILNKIIKQEETITIIVSHRFQNIKKVDKIIVVDNGEIEIVGTHDELLKNSEIYSELYEAQREMVQ